jgi:peptidoglycan/LPS O-acetylase OafA/YrhL
VAVFIVFTWHFANVNYANNGYDTPVPIFPLSLLSEGHTGVAIFMTLSAYLFAKLLDGKKIDYKRFLWNRFIRLVPLLAVVLLIVGLTIALPSGKILLYIQTLLAGVVQPVLPNGAWSITTEFHFYLLLPLLLLLASRSRYALLVVLLSTILLRIVLYHQLGQIQILAYSTIIGRIDQFLLGIITYQFRGCFTRKHVFVASIVGFFAVLYWQFDLQGGFYHNSGFPSHSPVWIYMPTLEGVAYAAAIAWYDNSFEHPTGRLSRFIAAIGTYSYSIYLLHFFFFPYLATTINHYVDLSNIYLALLASPIAFLVMIPIGYMSHRFVESPFFRFRTKYILEATPTAIGKT